MKKFAKILSILLCLAMVTGMIAVVASAEEVDATVWTKVSLADIQPTDTIAITMSKGEDTWVLPTVANGSKGQPLGNDIVISSVNDTTLTTVDGTVGCGWTIVATEGGYHIKSGENYLYLIADNNGMRIGSTAAVWTQASNGYLCTTDSKDAVRYMGVYTSAPDWRCYTAMEDGSMKTNIADQAVTFWKKTGTAKVTLEELEPITIADARKTANDTEVAVSGTVTYVSGKSVTIQDDTGAIVLYFASDNHGFTVGDVLEATGTKSTYGQIHQLSGAKAEKTGTKTLTPAETTIPGITAEKLGQYIKLSGVEVTEVYDGNGKYANPNVTVKDADGKTIQIYKAVVDKNSDGSWAVKVGDTVDVSAVIAIYQKSAQNASGQYELTGEYTLQLNNVSGSEIVVKPADSETPSTSVSAIKDVLAAASGDWTVTGVITYIGGRNIYVQDTTGGICVYVPKGTDTSDIAVGDVITASGTYSAYEGLPELTNATYSKATGSTLTLTAKEAAISTLTNADICTYVKIVGAKVSKIDGKYYTLSQGDATITLYNPVLGDTVLNEGDTITVTGAVGCYKSIQLCNSLASEIVVTEKATVDPTPSEPVTPSEPDPPSKEYIVLYNPENSVYVTGTDYLYTSSSSGSQKHELETSESIASALALTVVENGSTVSLVTADGKYLYADGNDVKLVSEAGEYTQFVLEATDGGYFIRCATATYYDKPQYLEIYSGYLTCYSMNESKAGIYTFQLKEATAIPETGDTTISVTVALLLLSGVGVTAMVAKKKEF